MEQSTTPVKNATQATAPMYIDQPVPEQRFRNVNNLTSTHPPLAERNPHPALDAGERGLRQLTTRLYRSG